MAHTSRAVTIVLYLSIAIYVVVATEVTSISADGGNAVVVNPASKAHCEAAKKSLFVKLSSFCAMFAEQLDPVKCDALKAQMVTNICSKDSRKNLAHVEEKSVQDHIFLGGSSSMGRRGAGSSACVGSFVMGSSNRAGNSEDDEDDENELADARGRKSNRDAGGQKGQEELAKYEMGDSGSADVEHGRVAGTTRLVKAMPTDLGVTDAADTQSKDEEIGNPAVSAAVVSREEFEEFKSEVRGEFSETKKSVDKLEKTGEETRSPKHDANTTTDKAKTATDEAETAAANAAAVTTRSSGLTSVPLDPAGFQIKVNPDCKYGRCHGKWYKVKWVPPAAWQQLNGKDLFQSKRLYPVDSIKKEGVEASVTLGGISPGSLAAPIMHNSRKMHPMGAMNSSGVLLEIAATDTSHNFVASEIQFGTPGTPGILCHPTDELMVIVQYQVHEEELAQYEIGDSGSQPKSQKSWANYFAPEIKEKNADGASLFRCSGTDCTLKLPRLLTGTKLQLQLWCTKKGETCVFDPKRVHKSSPDSHWAPPADEPNCYSQSGYATHAKCPPQCPGLALDQTKGKSVLFKAKVLTPRTKFLWSDSFVKTLQETLPKIENGNCLGLLNHANVMPSFDQWKISSDGTFSQDPPPTTPAKTINIAGGSWKLTVSKKRLYVQGEGSLEKHMICYQAPAATNDVCCVTKFSDPSNNISAEAKKTAQARLKNF